jgi:hypothetical protein
MNSAADSIEISALEFFKTIWIVKRIRIDASAAGAALSC